MKTTKDSSARMMRLAQRNALITALFYELTTREGESFMQAYVFLETIFGIDGRQIRKILCQKSKVELSSTNVTKFAVLLSSETARLSELRNLSRRKPLLPKAEGRSASPHRMHFVGVRWGPR